MQESNWLQIWSQTRNQNPRVLLPVGVIYQNLLAILGHFLMMKFAMQPPYPWRCQRKSIRSLMLTLLEGNRCKEKLAILHPRACKHSAPWRAQVCASFLPLPMDSIPPASMASPFSQPQGKKAGHRINGSQASPWSRHSIPGWVLSRRVLGGLAAAALGNFRYQELSVPTTHLPLVDCRIHRLLGSTF